MRNLIKGSIFLLAGAASFAVAHAGVDIEERPLVILFLPIIMIKKVLSSILISRNIACV